MPNCPNCGNEYNPGDEVCPDCGLVFPFTTDVLAPGTVLQSRYEIQELSHTGGMGYIYLAKDKKLYDRLCIVKQVKEPVKSDSDLKKLEEEARRMAKLSHPNVAMVLDHFVENGYYFLIVERVSGKTLSEVFAERHGQLTEEEVVNWAIAMCDVISYIHSEGIIHRDVSPDNIMLTKDGSIKFVDFGTLRELRYIATRGTAGMGKYGYTPPEQWQGKPTPQSDVFALGATIYYLLTGSLPLSREYLSGQGPQRQDFSPSFPLIRTKKPNVSPELEAILQRALQLDANSRYSSAAEMGQALKSLGKVEARRWQPVEEAKPPPVLSVYPERLSFADVRPGSRSTKSLTLKNIGTGRLTGSITGTQPWIKVSPSTISLLEGEQKVLVTVETSGLASGFNSGGDINIATNGGMARVKVNLSMLTVAKPARKKWGLFTAVAVALFVALLMLFGLNKLNMLNLTWFSGENKPPVSVPASSGPEAQDTSLSNQPPETPGLPASPYTLSTYANESMEYSIGYPSDWIFYPTGEPRDSAGALIIAPAPRLASISVVVAKDAISEYLPMEAIVQGWINIMRDTSKSFTLLESRKMVGTWDWYIEYATVDEIEGLDIECLTETYWKDTGDALYMLETSSEKAFYDTYPFREVVSTFKLTSR